MNKCLADSTVQYAQCPDEVDAFRTCYGTEMVITCSGSQLKAQGCVDETIDHGACVVCITLPGDDACTACRRSKCCAEWTAVLESPEYAEYYACMNACETTLCNCSQPVGGVHTALNACGNANCEAEC